MSHHHHHAFIELTALSDGKPMYFNVDRIAAYDETIPSPDVSATRIIIEANLVYIVKESIAEVSHKIFTRS